MLNFFKYHILKAKLQILSEAEVCMPIQIFSLSRKLAEFHPNDKVQELYDEFILNDNAFVRRAMITTIRFIGEDFAKKNAESVRSRLNDNDGWVAYDAIWVLSEHDLINVQDEKIIKTFASRYEGMTLDQLSEISPQESEEYRDKMAAEVVCKIESA